MSEPQRVIRPRRRRLAHQYAGTPAKTRMAPSSSAFMGPTGSTSLRTMVSTNKAQRQQPNADRAGHDSAGDAVGPRQFGLADS